MRSLIALLLVALLGGCNGNAGTQGAQTVPFIYPGTQESFVITVENDTQFPVYVFISATGGAQQFGVPAQPGTGVLVYPGTAVQTDVGFLPAIVSIDVIMQTTPLYQFPTRTFTLGTDFNYWQSSISTSYP